MTTNDTTTEATLQDVNETMGGDAASLVGQILLASARSIQWTTDRLLEYERERRQALEVHFERALELFDEVAGGTVREYEDAVTYLRYGHVGNQRELAALHEENHSR